MGLTSCLTKNEARAELDRRIKIPLDSDWSSPGAWVSSESDQVAWQDAVNEVCSILGEIPIFYIPWVMAQDRNRRIKRELDCDLAMDEWCKIP